jgi:phosphatidylserine/phosphatidylglycerophosphate/cardiolipin synthase-like enzyme
LIESGDYPRFATRSDYDFGGYFDAIDRDANDQTLMAARFGSLLKAVRKVAFVSDEPGKSKGYFSNTARITRELRKTLEHAKNEIVMQTPYLVLSKPAQKLIEKLRVENPALQIRISSNSFASTDNLMAYSANYRLRNNYVNDLGLEVHEFKPLPASLMQLFPRYSEMTTRAKQRISTGAQTRLPFLCLHAKSLVVDDAVAFVGSYNLDPRSEALNTEVGLLVEDPAFARQLREEIERDMRAENSWVIARRDIPLGLDAVNGLIGGLLGLGPVDLWPVQNTSSFELKAGAQEVPANDPLFYKNYREVGSFPGAEGMLSQKEILTRIYKAVGSPLTPIL